MPKGNKSKKKKEKHQEDGGATGLEPPSLLSPDEDSESVCSSLPDTSSVSDEVVSDHVDDSDNETELQFQLSELIDQLLDKNSRTRLAALKSLNELLRRKMVSHLLLGREETVNDILMKGLRKSKGQERCDLLLMASVLALQLGDGQYSMYGSLKPLLLTIIKDPSVSAMERATALSTCTFLCFLLCQDFLEVQSVMHECEGILQGVKNDSIVTSSVKGWSLLLSIVPDHVVPALISSVLPRLTDVLEKSGDLNVKVVTGQAIALLLEITKEVNDDLMDSEEVDNACDVIQAVASESNRYAGRKERSQQRSVFKDLVSAVESGDVPERRIKFGMETLQLDSWARIVQYGTLTDMLGTGMANHLQNNGILREIFQMGMAPPTMDPRQQRVGKIEKKLYNAACAKFRSQSRGKQRDKRSVL